MLGQAFDTHAYSCSDIFCAASECFRIFTDPSDNENTCSFRRLPCRDVNNLFLLYVFDEILDITAKLSCCFQKSDLALVDLEGWLEAELNSLTFKFTYHKDGSTARAPPELSATIKELVAALKDRSGKWHGHELSLKKRGSDESLTWDEVEKVLAFNYKYIHSVCTKFISLIRERFPTTDLGMAGNFGIFAVDKLAGVEPVKAMEYGLNELSALGEFYEKQGFVKVSVVVEEWRHKAVSKLVKAADAFKKKHGRSATARAFYKEMKGFLEICAPNLWTLIQIMLVLQPASAEVERGFSTMNDVKSLDRTRIRLSILDALMRICLCGPEIDLASSEPFAAFDRTILGPAVEKWKDKVRCPSRSSHNVRPKRVKHKASESDSSSSSSDEDA